MKRTLAALLLVFTLSGCATIQSVAFKLAIIWAVYEANFSPQAQTVANVVACAPGVWNATLLVGG